MATRRPIEEEMNSLITKVGNRDFQFGLYHKVFKIPASYPYKLFDIPEGGIQYLVINVGSIPVYLGTTQKAKKEGKKLEPNKHWFTVSDEVEKAKAFYAVAEAKTKIEFFVKTFNWILVPESKVSKKEQMEIDEARELEKAALFIYQ